MTDYGRKRYPAASSEYILLEEVGQGVSAIVYRARCVRFNDIIAIKILDLERCNSNLEDICREAQTMSLINHSNVVSAYCSFVVDKSLWIVMPYMAGGSCLHIMKSAYPEGFKEVLIATILKETLKALVYLHSHGHIHRDVKAGNILVDSHGVVKLGDFGVAACMFDTGVRQRSRNTFVGTPCWMAPEVMRQIHGYDFKADIWSFGITALELAHGHAPFSKYPPNKVLLMTLQNAPPGLDYERDKKFSKAFKEMVTLCLVKDPTKRPSAEKLLRHSFFKRVKSAEYLVQNILNGLAPLAQRFKDLKIEDAEKLAQKMISSGEKEEISQNEYIRGISGWNFDVEELKAQAALIPDDDDSFTGKESTSSNSSEDIRSLAEINDHLQPFSPPPFKHILVDSSTSPAALSSEGCRDAGDSIKKIRPILLPSPMQLRTTDVSRNEVQPEPTFNENQKRFEATEDNRENMQLGFDGNQNRVEATELEITEAIESGNDEEMPKRKEVKDLRREKVLMAGRRALSGPLNSEYAETGHGSQCEATDRDSSVSSGFDDKRSLYSGATSAYVVPRQYRSLNGLVGLTNSISGIQDVMEKGNTIQRRGRFSVTSENSNLSGIHPIASNGDLLPTSVIIPHLQNILQQSISQQESIRSFMNLLNEAEAPNKNHPLSPLGSRHLSQSSGIITADSLSNLSGNNPTASNSNLFPVSVITPHLQSILQQSMSQQESIRSLMNLLNEAEAPNTYRPSSPLGSGHLSLKVQSLGSPNLSIGNSVDQLQIVKLEMHQ